jgi:hypothetical protein
MRLNEIQQQIDCGQYRIDAHAVAEAIVRRLMQDLKLEAAESPCAQDECS